MLADFSNFCRSGICICSSASLRLALYSSTLRTSSFTMAITLLTSPPEALSREELAAISAATPSTFEGIAPLTRHHESAGVRIRLEPGFEGWTGHGLEGALWITEGCAFLPL